MQTTIPAIMQHGIQRADAAQVCLSAEAVESIPYGRILAQQGDLYFYRVQTVRGMQRMQHPSGQLAPGTTRGSRHCVDPECVQMYMPPHPNALQGAIIDAPQGVTVTHPEHGHITFPPGIYGVRFQRAYADELRRAAD